MKLLCLELGWYNTKMGDRPTEPPIISWIGNDYRRAGRGSALKVSEYTLASVHRI